MDNTSKLTVTMSVPLVQEGTNTRLVKEVKKALAYENNEESGRIR